MRKVKYDSPRSPERGSSVVECRTRNREGRVRITPLLQFREVWVFSFSPLCPSSLSCINEYRAIDSSGNASD